MTRGLVEDNQRGLKVRNRGDCVVSLTYSDAVPGFNHFSLGEWRLRNGFLTKTYGNKNKSFLIIQVGCFQRYFTVLCQVFSLLYNIIESYC